MALSSPGVVTATYVHGDGKNISMRVACQPVAGAVGYEWSRWDNVGGAWIQLGRGTATTFTDSTIVGDRIYDYGVRAYSASETGPSSYLKTTSPGLVHTRPITALSVQAIREPGNQVRVLWTDRSYSETGWRVWHWWGYDGQPGAGQAIVSESVIGDETATGNDRWHIQAIDPQFPHWFQVQPFNPSGAGDWSPNSNVVAQVTDPLPPVLVSPNGTSVPHGGAVVFTVEHTPFDGTPQSAKEIEYRAKGTTTWTSSGKLSGGSASWTGPVLAVGDWEWRARTWGEHVDASQWATPVPFRVAKAPLAPTISSPSAGTYGQDRLYLAWVHNANGGTSQQAFDVELVSGGVTVLSERGYLSIQTWQSGAILDNGSSYTIRLRVQNRDGLWSPWTTRTINVAYSPPPAATVTAQWDEMAAVHIAWTTGQPTGGAPQAFDADIQRRIGSAQWETLATDRPITGSYEDRFAPLRGDLQYRVITHAQVGTHNTSAPASPGSPGTGAGASSTDSWITLTSPGGAVARIRSAPSQKDSLTSHDVLVYFDGNPDPHVVPVPTDERSGTVAGSLIRLQGGAIHGGASEPDAFRAMCREPAVLLRDPVGTYAWVKVTGLDLDHTPGLTRVSFSWRQVAR